MPSKLKVYFLHNIDGRICGMIAATSKKAVRDIARRSGKHDFAEMHSDRAIAFTEAARDIPLLTE